MFDFDFGDALGSAGDAFGAAGGAAEMAGTAGDLFSGGEADPADMLSDGRDIAKGVKQGFKLFNKFKKNRKAQKNAQMQQNMYVSAQQQPPNAHAFAQQQQNGGGYAHNINAQNIGVQQPMGPPMNNYRNSNIPRNAAPFMNGVANQQGFPPPLATNHFLDNQRKGAMETGYGHRHRDHIRKRERSPDMYPIERDAAPKSRYRNDRSYEHDSSDRYHRDWNGNGNSRDAYGLHRYSKHAYPASGYRHSWNQGYDSYGRGYGGYDAENFYGYGSGYDQQYGSNRYLMGNPVSYGARSSLMRQYPGVNGYSAYYDAYYR